MDIDLQAKALFVFRLVLIFQCACVPLYLHVQFARPRIQMHAVVRTLVS